MPNKKSVTKKNKKVTKAKDTKSTSEEIIAEQETAASEHTPTDVEGAYWQEKVTKSTLDITEKSAKSVEDYVSNIMVVAKPNESSEQLLRRFNREVRDLNLMDDIRERLEYEKPSQKRKRLKREKYLASKQRRYWE